MIKYDTLEAVQPFVEPTFRQMNRFYVQVEAEDGNTYQVKFNVSNFKSNQNEFLFHYTGRMINAPVLHASFVRFSNDQIDYINTQLKLPAAMSSIKDNTLFGVMWQKDISYTLSNNDLIRNLDESRNRKDFFSIYPHDHLLHNHDRCIDNHIFIFDKDRKVKKNDYMMIDGDRLFNHLSWTAVSEKIHEFKCMDKDHHKFLNDIVDDSSYKYIEMFSTMVEAIRDNDILAMISELKSRYSLKKDEIDTITHYFMERKKGFRQKFYDHCSCFNRLKQRPLISDGLKNAI